MGPKESAVAKATGLQDELDMTRPDVTFLEVLYNKRKISKEKAKYTISKPSNHSCVKCKFNLGDEGKCHIVKGQIDNEEGLSKLFSPKGDGMLPGDIVWMYVKQTGKKLKYKEGHVIRLGAVGFRCKDCKYYLHSRGCLLIEGVFRPKMSCGFVVRTSHGTAI